MMITVNRVGDYITGSANGKPFSVTFTDQRWAEMKQLEISANEAETMEDLKEISAQFEPLLVEDYKELIEHAKGGQFLWVERATGKTFLRIGQLVSNIPLPKVFIEKIITSVEKKIDVLPLVKCWARFIREIPGRPTYTAQRGHDFAYYIDADYTDPDQVKKLMAENGFSHEVARQRATAKQVSITQEGLLVCYKVSREITQKFVLDEDTEEVKQRSRYQKTVDPDTGVVTLTRPDVAEELLFQPYVQREHGDAFFCGNADGGALGHFIKVGRLHKLMSWDQVSQPGYKGLHCGGLEYIKGYSEGTDAVTHNVFVDPMHIHTVRTNGDGALTCKEYFVHSTMIKPNKSIYHSSDYAALGDAEFESLITEVIKGRQQQVEELTAQQLGLKGTGKGNGAKLFIEPEVKA